MSEFVLSLAHEARRTSLVTTLQRQHALTLERLDELLAGRKYGDDLAQITIAELLQPKQQATPTRLVEPIESTILRVFRAQPDAWLTSGFFTRHLGVPRWTAQGTLATLAERGLLVRRGKTSATRYCLAPRSNPPGR